MERARANKTRVFINTPMQDDFSNDSGYRISTGELCKNYKVLIFRQTKPFAISTSNYFNGLNHLFGLIFFVLKCKTQFPRVLL
jgi:hypothetical protein